MFVIGDPDQSIYSFRGADAACFDRLRSDCPQTRTITLTRNYRSTPEILSCALQVVEENGGAGRRLTAARPSGAAVRLLHAESERAEAVFTAKEIAAGWAA